jgi:hypothetical protein
MELLLNPLHTKGEKLNYFGVVLKAKVGFTTSHELTKFTQQANPPVYLGRYKILKTGTGVGLVFFKQKAYRPVHDYQMIKYTYTIAFCLTFAMVPSLVFAKKAPSPTGNSHAVNGHFKKDGTYVQPHRATNPNQTQRDNWSSKPNVNPYTGKPGTKEAEK